MKRKTAVLVLGACLSIPGWAQGSGSDSRRAASATSAVPTINLLSNIYRLGSRNQTPHPMWEFVTSGENVTDWTSLVTLVDRTDAKTVPERDRLAEGIMSNYKSHGGRVLAAKTLRDDAGRPFNYILVAFRATR